LLNEQIVNDRQFSIKINSHQTNRKKRRKINQNENCEGDSEKTGNKGVEPKRELFPLILQLFDFHNQHFSIFSHPYCSFAARLFPSNIYWIFVFCFSFFFPLSPPTRCSIMFASSSF
jgi:hypothetical protein